MKRFRCRADDLYVVRADLRAEGEIVRNECVLRLLDAIGEARVVNLAVDNREETADQAVVLLNIEVDVLAQQLGKVLSNGTDLTFVKGTGNVQFAL